MCSSDLNHCPWHSSQRLDIVHNDSQFAKLSGLNSIYTIVLTGIPSKPFKRRHGAWAVSPGGTGNLCNPAVSAAEYFPKPFAKSAALDSLLTGRRTRLIGDTNLACRQVLRRMLRLCGNVGSMRPAGLRLLRLSRAMRRYHRSLSHRAFSGIHSKIHSPFSGPSSSAGGGSDISAPPSR